jgi:hypothetical protein
VSEQIATWIWLCLTAYAASGALVWIALMLGLMKRLDASAAVAPLRVKAILAPGLIALWPIVLAILIRPPERVS